MQSVENFAITAVGSLEEAGPGRKTDEEFANEYHLPNYPDPLATQAQLTGLPKDSRPPKAIPSCRPPLRMWASGSQGLDHLPQRMSWRR